MLFILLVVVSTVCTVGMLLALPAKLTVRVVDEEGHPLVGAQVRLGFETFDGARTDTHKAEGDTGLAGQFIGSVECSGHVSFSASKAGYYYSSGESFDLERSATGTYWEPWNCSRTLTLKKKTILFRCMLISVLN